MDFLDPSSILAGSLPRLATTTKHNQHQQPKFTAPQVISFSWALLFVCDKRRMFSFLYNYILASTWYLYSANATQHRADLCAGLSCSEDTACLATYKSDHLQSMQLCMSCRVSMCIVLLSTSTPTTRLCLCLLLQPHIRLCLVVSASFSRFLTRAVPPVCGLNLSFGLSRPHGDHLPHSSSS